MRIERMRRGYRLESEVALRAPVEEVFSFFADAGNLEQMTPRHLRFEIRTPRPIEMRTGALIDYRLKVRGFPMKWRSEISTWDPPRRFVDEQVVGPYKLWIHEHSFEERGGRTIARDVVEYDVPGGPLSRLIHWLFVGPDLRRIFEFRARRLHEMFGAPG